MATSSMVPYSNPAGKNQTSPSIGVPTSGAGATKTSGPMPVTSPIAVSGAGTSNPFIPAPGAGTTPGVPSGVPMTGTTSVPNVGGLTDSTANVSGTTGALQKQLTDIYGKGVGGALASLLSGMSGSDSKVLQEYIASLQPQFAKSQADLGASLGAGGVSPNSSVAALGEANLKAQEDALIAGESGQLTLGQEQLTSGILGSEQGAASKEVASSGWDVFGQVMGGLGNLAGSVISAGGEAGGLKNLFKF